MKTVIIILAFIVSSVLFADLQVKEVGWNTYKWGDGNYYINDVLVYKIPKDLIPAETALEENKCWSENHGGALAFFSNMVTLKIGGNEMCNGMAHPNHWVNVTTYRVGKKGQVKEIALTDLFQRDVILEQLYKDPYLIKKYSADTLVDTKTHIKRDFEKRDGVCEGVDTSTLNNFAIHHVKGDQVAVRLFLKTCANSSVNLTKQIGFYLPATGSLLEAIQLSSDKKFLMKDLSPD